MELEEARKDSPTEALEGAARCQHPDFGLVASRTGREDISVALSYVVCGTLFGLL